jgi:TatD DNase family protein
MWIDTHCHLDALLPPGGWAPGWPLREQARDRGVACCVIPAVSADQFDAVRLLAHQTGDAYALGIHPLCVPQATDADLLRLEQALLHHIHDPRLVAVGEIGLDFFVPALCEPAMRARQQHVYQHQLGLAARLGLPVILHVRRSVDAVVQGLRRLSKGRGGASFGGIAHAFNGSDQQAQQLVDLGFKLGLGGAATFDAANRLRHLAAHRPLTDLVLETDAPDIPPQWLYVTAADRAAGRVPAPNTPAELPRIGAVVAGLRGITTEALAGATTHNACAVLPKLRALLGCG